MQRTLLNLIVDLVAAALFLAMIATGYLIRFPLPPGTNKSLSLWGLTRHQWGEIHFWISLGLLSVLAVHFILHCLPKFQHRLRSALQKKWQEKFGSR